MNYWLYWQHIWTYVIWKYGTFCFAELAAHSRNLWLYLSLFMCYGFKQACKFISLPVLGHNANSSGTLQCQVMNLIRHLDVTDGPGCVIHSVLCAQTRRRCIRVGTDKVISWQLLVVQCRSSYHGHYLGYRADHMFGRWILAGRDNPTVLWS